MATADRNKAAEERARCSAAGTSALSRRSRSNAKGYVVRGLTARVAEVDAQIALYRGEAPAGTRGRSPPPPRSER